MNLLSLLTVFVFTVSGFIALPASAVTLNQSMTEVKGVLRIQNTFECAANDTFCTSLCGERACGWVEPFCRDCFGTSDQVMRDVFQTLVPTYEPGHEVDERAAIIQLLRRTSVLVANKGVYDFYNSSSDVGFSDHLQNICGSRDGFIGVLLDENNRPSKAYMAICTSPGGLVTRRLRPASEAEVQSLPENGIRLKLDTELKSLR